SVTRKWFVLVSCTLIPTTLVINAPFGRFAPKSKALTFDGRISWFWMEIVSPITFAYNFIVAPLTRGVDGDFSRSIPQMILAGCYLIHYANRAIISPYTNPSRSRAHLIVPIAGVSFNLPNGFLMGSYLSSPVAHAYLANASSRPIFWLGVGLWAAGFIGNVIHDEILANIRRRAAKDKDAQHYAIPQGLLYRYVSFPNYFCEWIEWLGFALAASPLPSLALADLRWLLSMKQVGAFLLASPATFAPSLTPPYIFLLNEILLMIPRAYRGHQWYKEKFGAAFPKERKVVVPFVF
ncbi:3-oxo-5-alpha-steroid 4-dehydrogenase-domain-containing protein, partial [Mycena floridula]